MNERYEKSVSDDKYISRLVEKAQSIIDTMYEECESSTEGDYYSSDE